MSSETTKEAAVVTNKIRRRSSSASASAFASTSALEKTTKPSLGATKRDKVIPRQLVPRAKIEVPRQLVSKVKMEVPRQLVSKVKMDVPRPIVSKVKMEVLRPIVVAKKHTKRMPLKATAMNPASKKQPSLAANTISLCTNAPRPSSAKPSSITTSTALLYPVRKSIPMKKKVLPDLLGGTSQPMQPQESAEVRSANVDYSIATVSTQLVPVTPNKPSIYIDPDMDKNDPQMCTEYAKDIYTYLLETERKSVYLIEGGFLNQTDFTVKTAHRSVLVDWLIQVQQKFRLLSETMYLCVDILDRAIQLEPDLLKNQLQLVGVTALLIASKYEEIYPPTLTELVYLTDRTYTKKEVMEKEVEILIKLDYQFNRPHGITFLRRYSAVMGTTTKVHNLAKYILELSMLDHCCSSLLPSKKAAAALVLSNHIMTPYKESEYFWDENMAYNTKYQVLDFELEHFKLKRSLKEGHNSPKTKAIREKYVSIVLTKLTTRMMALALC